MKRTIKSYVLRAGRMSTRQKQGFDQWLQEYELQVSNAEWNLEALFARSAPTVVEIGFGMGSSLFEMAKRQPEVNFIGIEVHPPGLGALAADLHDAGLTNVRLVAHDAVAVLATQIPKQSLAGVQIFFPDPWPKKKHHKRRLIQPEFVKQLVELLEPGGWVHCATDWEDYAQHMLEVLNREPSLTNQNKDGGYSLRPEIRPVTKFERRGERLGHGVWDLFFYRLKK